VIKQVVKICHLTTVHPVYDTRIFYKESISLVKKGYRVHLIAPATNEEVKEGVNIIPLGVVKSRLRRLLFIGKQALKKALELDAVVYHFHDPELISVGLKLKRMGKKVIFDIHEDVSEQILTKNYIPKILRKPVSYLYSIYERRMINKMDALICATPFIEKKYSELNNMVVNINNYPILNELVKTTDWNERENAVAYIGGITEIRGVCQIVESLEYSDADLYLAGTFDSEKTKQKVVSLKGWKKVKYLGQVDREEVKEILSKVKAGIVTFLPAPNHFSSQPNKLFEYMSAGVPIIASNFPLWKDIVEKRNAGICVDPQNPREIGAAINRVIHDSKAETMGKSGRKSVEEEFNWGRESEKLFELYERILSN
jgi:glycosyltransferase involved in cell wall biosynthesis